jgi:hypothetical protein
MGKAGSVMEEMLRVKSSCGLAASTGDDSYQPGPHENQRTRFRRNAASAHLASAGQRQNVVVRIHVYDVETTRGCEDAGPRPRTPRSV